MFFPFETTAASEPGNTESESFHLAAKQDKPLQQPIHFIPLPQVWWRRITASGGKPFSFHTPLVPSFHCNPTNSWTPKKYQHFQSGLLPRGLLDNENSIYIYPDDVYPDQLKGGRLHSYQQATTTPSGSVQGTALAKILWVYSHPLKDR